jgi:hypothetical protein
MVIGTREGKKERKAAMYLGGDDDDGGGLLVFGDARFDVICCVCGDVRM